MRNKPAALSASLVAVKGMAAPTPDMPSRGTEATPAAPLADSPALSGPGGQAPEAEADRGSMPLNFRVPDSFRREFKVYAAKHGLKLNELLRRSFEAYRRSNGE
jgi:hypothetical protein